MSTEGADRNVQEVDGGPAPGSCMALPLLGVSGFWQDAIYGAVILVALVVDRSVRTGGVRGLLGRDVA